MIRNTGIVSSGVVIRFSLLGWLGLCFATSAAEIPAPTGNGPTNLPLVTIRHFLDNARDWGQTNFFRLQGVVTASLADKSYFIQDGHAGIYIFHRPAAALQVGEWVEVTGHPSLGNLNPLLDGTAVRSIETRALPPAVPVTFAEAMSGRHNMRLIRIQGRLADERPRGGRDLVLNAGGSTNSFIADLSAVADYERLANIKPGSVLEITGVCSVRPDATRKLPVSFTVFGRSAADVVVLRGPPWWSRERTFAALGIALAVLAVSLLWIWTLRRQVGRQTADLRERLEKQTTLERRYRQLFEANPHPMWVYDLESLRFLAVNAAAIHHYGFSRAEFLGMTIRDIRPREDLPALEAAVASVAPGLNPAGFWRHRKKSGELIEVEINSHTIEFDGRQAELVLAHDVTERRKAEAALRQSEQYRRTIFEAEPECVKVVGADGTLLDMNPAGLAMLEAGSIEEARSTPLWKYLLPQYQAAFAELHQRVIGGGNGELEFELEGLKGTRRWLETRAVQMPGAGDGKPVLLAITRDITERKRAENQLRQSQKRFATVFKTIPDAIMIVRVADEIIVDVNPAFARLSGFTAEEMKGRTTQSLDLWVDPAQRSAALTAIRQSGAVRNLEFLMRTKSGQILTVLGSGEAIEFGGEPCLLSITRDVTDLKLAEEALRRSEASLAAAQRVASLGSWETELVNRYDTDSNPLTWSDEVFRIFGHEPHSIEVTKENFFRAVHPDDRERVRQAMAEALAQRSPYSIDHRIVRPDGTERFVHEYAEIIPNPTEGKPPRMLGVVQDITERKQAEIALQERERVFATLLKNLSGMVYCCKNDADWTTTFVSEGCLAVTGYAAEDLLGNRKTSLGSLIHPEDAGRVWEKCQANLVARRACSNEYRIRTATGEERWVWDQAQGIYSDAGELLFVEGYISDITDRKRAEAALRKSLDALQRTQHSIDSVTDGIFWIDQDARLVFVNQAACRNLGYTADALLRMRVFDVDPVFPPADWPLHWAEIQARRSFTLETLHRTRDGRDIPVEVQVNCVEYGGHVFNCAIARDITERKRAEAALQESEARFRQLIEHAPEAVVLLDATTGRFVQANPAAERLFKIPAGEICNVGPIELSPALQPGGRSSSEGGQEFINRAMAGETPVFEWTHRDAEGHDIPCEVRLLRMTLGGRTVVRGSVTDIAERKRAEEEKEKLQAQLTQAQKMESVGRLAGGVAHDFNNMLQVILGNMALTLMDLPPDSPLRENLEEAQNSAQRSADLTRQLLAFARKQTIAPKVLDLNDTVEGLLKMLRRLIGEHINLVWLPGANLGSVNMDPSQVDQILANLCVNARDALGDGVGKVTLETSNMVVDEAYMAEHPEARAGDYVRLAVSDNGCGMSMEVQAHLFEPFFTTKGVGEGTGLGLATVYGIVEQNLGFITVRSEPGHGTTFQIHLPRHAARAISAATEASAPASSRGKETILLVEDEPSILRVGQRVLENLGYRVLAARTPGEAIQLAREHVGEIHLLLTDVVMPEMNGRDLAKNLLNEYPNLKRLFMSGYTADLIAHHGVLEPGVHFIEKPFGVQDMADKVRGVLQA